MALEDKDDCLRRSTAPAINSACLVETLWSWPPVRLRDRSACAVFCSRLRGGSPPEPPMSNLG